MGGCFAWRQLLVADSLVEVGSGQRVRPENQHAEVCLPMPLYFRKEGFADSATAAVWQDIDVADASGGLIIVVG